MDLFFLASSSVALGLSIAGLIHARPRSESRDIVYEGICQAPLWLIVQSLESMICSPRTTSKASPLNRCSLQIQNSDPYKGTISATLEFVEKLKYTGLYRKRQTALLKRYGFVWVTEEILRNNNIEVVVSLLWRDLSSEKETKRELGFVSTKKSEYEEVIVSSIIAATRDVIANLNKSSTQRKPNPISGPPPVAPSFNNSFPNAPPISPQRPNSAAAAKAPKMPAGAKKRGTRASFQEMSRSAASSSLQQLKRTVNWPSPQDYHESIQNPSSCFAARELKIGVTELDNLGMPKVSSGAFASVYRVKSSTGDRAVRCFLHPIKDQEYRYKMLSNFIDPAVLPWMVSFEYLPEGIRVGADLFPILMMDWVEGTPLNIYVAELCANFDKARLEQLRNKFMRMCHGLRIAGVAHGDLQHGNILVRNGDLVLVDYDGMYVPGLKERTSNELGHPNYQHPQRTEHDFNELTDHFSAWAIDTALVCLAEDPDLWNRRYDDGESILFHRQDFLNPLGAPIFAELAEHASERIRKRSIIFRDFISRSLFEIPPLEDERKLAARADSSPVRPAGLIEPTPPPSPFSNNGRSKIESAERWSSAPAAAFVAEQSAVQEDAHGQDGQDYIEKSEDSSVVSADSDATGLPDWLRDVE